MSGPEQGALLDELERRLHLRGETIVAFALAGRPRACARIVHEAARSSE